MRRSSRSSSLKPPRRRSGSRSTGTRNCPSPAIGRRRRSGSRFCPGRDGALKALSVVAHSDAGVAINSTVAGLARLIYPAEAKELIDHDVVSDLPPGCAFRGPGGPPMAFALEQAIDEAALRLKSIPLRCASAGIRTRTGGVSTIGRPGSRHGAGARAPKRRPGATAAASASPWATGSISGKSERKSRSRSRMAASWRASPRRTSAPGRAASSPTGSRTNSNSSRTRSRFGSAIPVCRKDPVQAAAASPPRSSRR